MSTTLPSSMRASQYTTSAGGIEKNLKVNASAPLPKNASSLPKDSTLIKVAFTTPNPADVMLAEMPVVSSLLLSKPAIPCFDFSGTVVSTTLPDLRPGDRVFGMNNMPAFSALAEYVVVTGKENIGLLPDGVKLDDAAAIGCVGATSYQCIEPFVKSGSKVLINGGSGGTGTFGIQIAKVLGCNVTATCSGPNVDLCRSLGADEVIDYRTTDVIEHLKRQGTQYDLIIDNVGSYDIFLHSEQYLKPDGRYITIAGKLGLGPILNMMKMFLLPTWLGGTKRTAKFLSAHPDAKIYKQLGEWMAEGKVKTVIEKTYDLEEAGEAFARLKSGRTRGKLIIRVAGE